MRLKIKYWLWPESRYRSPSITLKELVMDPDAGMLAKECTKLGGLRPPDPPCWDRRSNLL